MTNTLGQIARASVDPVNADKENVDTQKTMLEGAFAALKVLYEQCPERWHDQRLAIHRIFATIRDFRVSSSKEAGRIVQQHERDWMDNITALNVERPGLGTRIAGAVGKAGIVVAKIEDAVKKVDKALGKKRKFK